MKGNLANDNEARKEAADREERRHFEEVLKSFHSYEKDLLPEIARRERHINQIPEEQRKRLPPHVLQHKFDEQRACVKANQLFYTKMLVTGGNNTVPKRSHLAHNASKVRSCLHQCAREWSAEGADERASCFNPMLDELKKHLNIQSLVLCPGAGLGRLPVEIVRAGFRCEANEFSYQMLLLGDYVMNRLTKVESQVIHPWIDNSCNVKCCTDITRGVRIPDMIPSDLSEGMEDVQLRMVAGEFIEVFSKDLEKFDGVTTCFFIDTAPNVFEYIQTIYNCLKPGGVWVNHGPLLWHWHSPEYSSQPRNTRGIDNRYNESIELSYDELKQIVLSYGFTIQTESWHQCTYSSDPRSMKPTLYDTVLFTAKKPAIQLN